MARENFDELDAENANIGNAESDSIDINNPHTSWQPLALGTNSSGQAFSLNIHDWEDGTNQHRAQILWDHEDDTVAHIGARSRTDPNGEDKPERFAIYTRDSPLGEDGSPQNRFWIQADRPDPNAVINMVSHLGIRADQSSDGELRMRRGDSDKDNRIRFEDSSGDILSSLEHADFGALTLRNFSGNVVLAGSDGVDINSDLDHRQNTSSNVVWDSGTTRPSNPNTGQRFFDADLGQPIWYDGTEWVDATGSAV